jgi:hypothetical protein
VPAIDPAQPDNNGSAAASASVPPGDIAVGVDPGTAAANATIRSDLAAVRAVNANRRAQYDADLAAYGRAVVRNDRQRAQYRSQQRAYADAMGAWRMQVAACQDGNKAACDAPSPRPADFR